MDDGRVELEGQEEDDSLDLTPSSGEGDIDRSDIFISDEPIQLLVEEDIPMINDQGASELETVQEEEEEEHIVEQEPPDQDLHPREDISAEDGKLLEGSENSGEKSDNATSSKPVIEDKVLIDTSAPIESVKDAVSKFGGLVTRKTHKGQDHEDIPLFKLQNEAAEEAKMQALRDLEATNRLIEELKLNLESAKAEELQAKQDSEVIKIKVKEMMEEQGMVEDDPVFELKCVKEEVEDLKKEYESLLNEKESAVKRAEDALSESKEIEKSVEVMNLELVSTKEMLEYALAAHLEAEEHIHGAVMDGEKDTLVWDKELKQAEEDIEMLNYRIQMEKDLKGKLNSALDMLDCLKSELAACMTLKLQDSEKKSQDEMQADLDQLKLKTEKRRDEMRCLKAESLKLKEELENEKEELTRIKQREEMVDIASLEAELEKTNSEIIIVWKREKETKDRMVKLKDQLGRANKEADDAKSAAESGRVRLRKVKEEVEEAKEMAIVVENRLLSVKIEIEAARASEKQAMDAIRELRSDSETTTTVPLEDYNELNKRSLESDEQAIAKMSDVMAQVEAAREAEKETLSKLEEANQELLARKEVYEHAINKAKKENEAKLIVEQELRKWSEENEQRRKEGDGEVDSPRESIDEQATDAAPSQINTGSKDLTESDSSNPTSPRSPDTRAKKKKKKHFIPHFLTMFTKKKTSSNT